MYALRS